MADTEQWIITFKRHGYNLKEMYAAIRNTAARDDRLAMLAELDRAAAEDQKAFAGFVRTNAGTVTKHLWAVNACVAELPAAVVAACRAHPAVAGAWPNAARGPSDLARAIPPSPSPIADSTDANNHNVAAAWATSPGPVKGEGVTIGFFDTGIDSNGDRNTPANQDRPHTAFWADEGQTVNPVAGTLRIVPVSSVRSRLYDPVQIGNIDCNSGNPLVHPWDPSRHPDARHGTGVAAIAAGGPGQFPSSNPWASGHAPRSLVMSWSIVDGDPQPTQQRWISSAAHYLAAIQAVRVWDLEDPAHELDILNISFDGWPEPDHPVSLGLDVLAHDLDVLIVTAGGNDGDSTLQSHGGFNQISVGAVHKRDSATERYVPMADSARGPVAGDAGRNYPDVCATGATRAFLSGALQPPATVYNTTTAQIRMPRVDELQPLPFTNPTNLYNARGTSMAAPQVAEAAALYRARRRAKGASDSALEARAAVLLNVDDPYALLAGQGLPQTTYRNRNTYGVGYVRDDYLVDYAERRLVVRALAADVTVQTDEDDTPMPAKIAYTKATAADTLYAVVSAWDRITVPVDPTSELPPLSVVPQLDLEVFHGDPDQGGDLIGQSRSPSSSFERVVFRTPSNLTDTIWVRVSGPIPAEYEARVFVAGRRCPATANARATVGTVGWVSQPASCTGTGVDQLVTRTIPTTYATAYGSFPFRQIVGAAPSAATIETWNGFQMSVASGDLWWNMLYNESVVGGAFTATAFALRRWRPFQGSGQLRIERMYLYESTAPPTGNPNDPLPHYPLPWNGEGEPGDPVNGTIVPSTVTAVVKDLSPVTLTVASPDWAATDWDTWPVIIPFDEPFTFSGDPDRHLGVAIRFGDTADLQFDAVDDEDGAPYGINQTFQSPDFGRAPIFGVVAQTPTTNAHPVLIPHGEPAVGQTVGLQILSCPLPSAGATTAAIHVGFAPANQPLASGCKTLLTFSHALEPSNIPLNPMGDAIVNLPLTTTALLFQDLYLQAVTLQGSTISTSNALVLHIGGTH